jgi:hypothetical protein
MLQTHLAQISTLLAAAAAALAVLTGRWPEQIVGLAFATDWLAGLVFQDHRLHHHIQAATFAGDVALLAVTLAAVIGSRRSWVLWAGAFCLLLVLTHVVMLLDVRFGQWTYLTAIYVWNFGLIATLIAGALLEGRLPAPAPPLRFRAARRSTPSATARSRN